MKITPHLFWKAITFYSESEPAIFVVQLEVAVGKESQYCC
jgi:hypothetical protein